LSYLLYCLSKHLDEPEGDGPAGVEGQPIGILTCEGLSAVISMLSAPELSRADLATVMSYQRVIDYFHRRRTIIPMRFGCVFSEEAQIVRFLEDHSEEYRVLLEQLEGCVEMGIRVLMDNRQYEARVPSSAGSDPAPPDPGLAGAGKGYLGARRSHYAARDQLGNGERAIIETVRGPFCGLFVRCKAEKSMPIAGSHESSARMLSLYFLVKREDVEKFRLVFQAFASRSSARILLSGPWPPFNFVLPEASQERWFSDANHR
jgi:hypothetical protein